MLALALPYFIRHLRSAPGARWNYIYYTMHLEALPVAQRNHHEMYLYDNWIENKITAPFPVKRSGVLEKVTLAN